MTRTHAALLILAAALIGGCDLALADCDQPARQQAVSTLYRGSVLPGERIHVATFDAAHGENYNRENCDIARRLFGSQPGVVVRYWCEPGRFKR
jgi:hypothetical protein